MNKPQYKGATWSLLAKNLKTGKTFYPHNTGRLSFTGSSQIVLGG